MSLRIVAAETYARIVLPETAPLWAGKRDLETYVANSLEIARSGFGRRHYRTMGIVEGKRLVSSFKRYDRCMERDGQRLRAFGIGAVFTPQPFRRRGYATAMLGEALDVARAEGYDLAYLFSDVHPQFYTDLGFTQVPSRSIVLRADALADKRLTLKALTEADWNRVSRCFTLCAGGGTIFERTPLIWTWIRMRMRQGWEHQAGQETNLAVRRGHGIAAYVLGVRLPERDTYVVDEYGYADEDAALTIPALLRAAAGDLRRVAGWLPPIRARDLVPKGSVRKRRTAIFMLAPLSSKGARLPTALAQKGRADPCWATDHI